MKAELQIAGNAKSQVDMIFDQVPVITDWDQVRRQVEIGNLTKDYLLAKLKNYEPMAECDPRDMDHWRDQQRLRLVLLHEAGMPLTGKAICDKCGKHHIDFYYAKKSWEALCLHCSEYEKQIVSHRNRGSCEFLKIAYDPRSNSWGLLYYWSHSRDEAFIFWLANFYQSREAAEQALWPISFYFRWLGLKNNGMIAEYLSFSRLLPIDEVMKLKLPLTPEQFRDQLYSIISQDASREQTLMGYFVDDAMREHERKDRDD